MLWLQNWEGNVLTETFSQSQKQILASACGSTLVTVGISPREQSCDLIMEESIAYIWLDPWITRIENFIPFPKQNQPQ